jgi:hypothetical protein
MSDSRLACLHQELQSLFLDSAPAECSLLTQAIFTNQDPVKGEVDESAAAGKDVVLLDVPRLKGGMSEMVNICGEQLESRLKRLQ